MCVAVPGKVLRMGRDVAVVQTRSGTRRASTLLLPDLEVGDYVLLSGGMAIERLDEEEALARLAIFRRLAEVSHESP